MKKFFIGAAAVALTIAGVSCQGGGAPKTADDSVAYAQGMMAGKQYGEMVNMSKEQGITMDKDAFLKGFEEAIKDTTSFSYFAGGITGSQLAKQLASDSVDVRQFVQAFRQAFKGDSTTTYLLTDSVAQELMMKFQSIKQERAMKKQEAELEKQFGANKEKGAKFIAAFKKEEGVKTTASGLAYKYLAQGTGATPKPGDKVKVAYIGTTVDGKKFDSNEDIEFPVEGVIKGWTEMLQLMKVGDKVKVVIPQELAYGSMGAGSDIEPFSTLVFEMELKAVVAGDKAADAHAH
ncbi:MAG: FKBP-type peptidyl-prolyl cis-trans isomerase [Porphyromonas sp.]|nr:FKBP-type peptidyl-prolyl cis-trans isomerase [Porphyromonas sp.]